VRPAASSGRLNQVLQSEARRGSVTLSLTAWDLATSVSISASLEKSIGATWGCGRCLIGACLLSEPVNRLAYFGG